MSESFWRTVGNNSRVSVLGEDVCVIRVCRWRCFTPPRQKLSKTAIAHALIVSPWPSGPGWANQSVSVEKSWPGRKVDLTITKAEPTFSFISCKLFATFCKGMYKKLDRSGELEYAGDPSTGDNFSPYKRGVILIRFHTRESIISLQHQIPHSLLIRIFYFVGRKKTP